MNDITQSGIGQIALQDIKDSDVNITQILGKSFEYQNLLAQLEREKKLLRLLPETDTSERLATSQKINEIQSQIEQFKKDVLSLAQTFSNIEINTERLKRAKEFFDKGELGEARAVLEIELEQMIDEKNILLSKREEYETDTLPKLKHKSEEFLVLAQSKKTDYSDPDRFTLTCKYFEHSIESYKTEDNLFKYGWFLSDHNKFNQAEKYYEEALTICRELSISNPETNLPKVVWSLNNIAILHHKRNKLTHAESEYGEALAISRKWIISNPETNLPIVAGTLNNIAILHSYQNKLTQAESEFEEALTIVRRLAVSNPETYIEKAALLLNNIAGLHNKQNKQTQAESEYKEALSIYRELAVSNPQTNLPHVARTLNNIALLHYNQNKLTQAESEFEEALTIRKELVVSNPKTYLPAFASTLNNIAILHYKQNKPTQAESEHEESLTIRRELAASEPQTYLPDVASTLVNLAILNQNNKPERDKSISYAKEAVEILKDFVEIVPDTQKYMDIAKEMLQAWEAKP